MVLCCVSGTSKTGKGKGHEFYSCYSTHRTASDVLDDLTLGDGGDRVAALGEDLHHVVGEVAAGEVATEDGVRDPVRERVGLVDRSAGVGDAIAQVEHDAGGAARQWLSVVVSWGPVTLLTSYAKSVLGRPPRTLRSSYGSLSEPSTKQPSKHSLCTLTEIIAEILRCRWCGPRRRARTRPGWRRTWPVC